MRRSLGAGLLASLLAVLAAGIVDPVRSGTELSSSAKGRVALLVGGEFGSGRMLALDLMGRTAAYGHARGVTLDLSLCPGGDRVAELAEVDSRSELVIRDARTLRVIHRRTFKELGSPEYASTIDVLCEHRSGSVVLVMFLTKTDSYAGWIERFARNRRTTLWNGRLRAGRLASPITYLSEGDDFADHRYVAVDLRDGGMSTLSLPPAVHPDVAFVPDASGERLAGVQSLGSKRRQFLLVDLTRRPVDVRVVSLPTGAMYNGVFWLPGGFLLTPWLYFGDALVLDQLAQARSGFAWPADNTTVIGSTIFGIDERGPLLRAELPAGPMRVVRVLSGRPRVIVSVPP